MGGEEHGIHPALMKICDEQFQVPMTGDFESLNVSVATGNYPVRGGSAKTWLVEAQ
jgi:tRNA G18 (ribose-2'-O)-methylase SpoU